VPDRHKSGQLFAYISISAHGGVVSNRMSARPFSNTMVHRASGSYNHQKMIAIFYELRMVTAARRIRQQSVGLPSLRRLQVDTVVDLVGHELGLVVQEIERRCEHR
jgi:hypothetical protein